MGHPDWVSTAEELLLGLLSMAASDFATGGGGGGGGGGGSATGPTILFTVAS